WPRTPPCANSTSGWTASSPSAAGSMSATPQPKEQGHERTAGRLDVRRPGAAGARRVLRPAGAVGAGAEPDRLRPVCAGRCRQPALRRVAELLGTVADADVLEGAVEHHLLRGGGRAAVGSGLEIGRAHV